MKLSSKAARILVVVGLTIPGFCLRAQENRKVIANPTPTYPETARQFHLSGVVKVQVVIATDGHIREVKVIGGHPLLVSAVQDALKNWKFAPANAETPELLVFNFHP